MKTDELSKILGYEPGRSQRLEILKTVKAEGISIQEATARYQLPAMFIRDENGLIEVEGKKMKPEQFRKENPYRKFVTVGIKNT